MIIIQGVGFAGLAIGVVLLGWCLWWWLRSVWLRVAHRMTANGVSTPVRPTDTSIERTTRTDTAENFTLELSGDEALVLFEWLATSCNESEDYKVPDLAEQLVLWRIEGALESSLSQRFSPDYAELVEKARAALRPHHPGYLGQS